MVVAVWPSGMDDRFQADKPPHTVLLRSHPRPFILLPSAGQEMSTGQSAVMLYGSGVKAGMTHSICG